MVHELSAGRIRQRPLTVRLVIVAAHYGLVRGYPVPIDLRLEVVGRLVPMHAGDDRPRIVPTSPDAARQRVSNPATTISQ